MLAPSKWLEALQGWIASLGVCSIALLAGIYVLATLFWAPEWPLTIAAGLINALGVPVAVVAETVAASLAFSRCVPLACDSVRHRLRRQRIFRAIDEAGWKIVALLRLGRAVPFTLQKYLFDSLRFPFWYYVMATLSGIIRHAGQCRPVATAVLDYG